PAAVANEIDSTRRADCCIMPVVTDRTNLVRLAERLVGGIAADTYEMSPDQWTLPVSRYHSDDRLACERATLFRRHPIAIGPASELTPGTCLRHDALAIPLVLARDDRGVVRAFLNV